MAALDVKWDELHAGAGKCGDAADAASEGADKLGNERLPAGIFGEFDEAHQFHEKVTDAHSGHVDQLRGHHQELAGFKQTAHVNANAFAEREVANTRLIGSATPDSSVVG